MANAIRILTMDAVEKAHSGHPGMPLGMADVATVLFTQFLKFDPQTPDWPNRDRFILSAGHGSMLLYALLYLTGYPEMTLAEIQNFRHLHSKTPGHPEWGHTAGVETTTGPLGQGLANAVGMALGEALLAAEFGHQVVNHRTYVIVGDGCLMEGISQEAISLAGHLQLSRLIVLFDDNQITIDGPTTLSTSDHTLQRFEACGWDVQAIDGHDPEAIAQAFEKAQRATRPSFIACRTIIGFGAPHKQGTAGIHGSPLGAEEVALARQALGWSSSIPFEIPPDILEAWRTVGQKGAQDVAAWTAALTALPPETQTLFRQRLAGELPQGWQEALHKRIHAFSVEKPHLATRQLSQFVLDGLSLHIPALLGGSADLTGSNNTLAKGMKPVQPGNFQGRYLYFGVREHAMAAALNGLALYGGFIPYGGTFLTFSDYARPAMRLAALMGLRVIYVMTHDSLGLGEDGPTHQPIEHLASLRAIPNLNVFRPADGVEVAECWAAALLSTHTPSVIALSRQAVSPVRLEEPLENRCLTGGYILREAQETHVVSLFSSGSEVGLACDVREALESLGYGTRVISLPCWRLFDAQPSSYRAHVLGLPPQGLAVAIEAASPFGWERYVGQEGLICGLETFGASAPFQQLYHHFQLTVSAIVNKIQEKLPSREEKIWQFV